MSPADYGWLVLGFPLLGTIVIALGWRALPGRSAGWIGSASILASFISALGALQQLQELPAEERHLESSLFDYVDTFGVSVDLGILVDPLSVLMILIVSGVSFLIHLYSVAYMEGDRGLCALLRVPQLLRLLDAAARPGGQLHPPDRRLGVRRRRVVPADLVLVPPRDGHLRRDQGVRDERDRRRRPGRRHVPPVRRHRRARLRGRVRGRSERVRRERRAAGGGVHLPAGRSVREVRPDPAAHVAPGRDGGPDARLRSDPRRDHGHRGRLPDRAHVAAVRARSGSGRRLGGHRHAHAVRGRDDRAGRDRPEARHRLLDDVADRLHGARASRRSRTARGCST